MLKQLRLIIGEGEKVKITYEDNTFSVKKQDLYDKVKILCQKKEELELNYTLGTIFSVRAIKLKDGIIYCYFKKENLLRDRPELKIQRQSDLYKLLKGMKNFD